ncbi:hypothetical protein C8J56DRAFT_1027693 [Mycena floridula]|nr:hypothetical protein C8J56DRAFT_1027693 [Mycena floridula]
MASQAYTHVEQDPANNGGDGDDLPTYDELAAQSGPNSRFGRWRGWIEKRAAERYVDITPEERARRRERGWGNPETLQGIPAIVNEPATPGPMDLDIMSETLQSYYPQTPPRGSSPPLPPVPSASQKLGSTHLEIHQFGSRFLPHATSPIRCLLPLLSDHILLIGHDEGLSVLDMYPQTTTETGEIAVKGPDEAQARLIWQGEGVFQMTLLEVESAGEGTPQGVVLLLVGPEPSSPGGKDSESLRAVRMYNLASLTSLAKYIISQKGRPVELQRPSNSNPPHTPTRKHRQQGSIARSLKSLIESPTHAPEHSPASYPSLLSPSASVKSTRRTSSPRRPSPPHRNSSDDSTWFVIEDLPLRWATDFVPLASPGSRLLNSSVLCYDVWHGIGQGRNQARLLAIATKSNILLYETPVGERAFRFVKEFYTPLQPKSITFFQQTVPELLRSPTDVVDPKAPALSAITEPLPSSTMAPKCPSMSFSKKGRLDPSGRFCCRRDGNVRGSQLNDSINSPRRSRLALEPIAGRWIPLSQVDVPAPSGSTKSLYLVTRGRQTHILPCPLLVGAVPLPPLRIVNWKHVPSNVSARVTVPPSLQLINMGEHGLEVQEISLSFLNKGKGKGKAVAEDVIWVEEDIGGDTGVLCQGGHWSHPHSAYRGLTRSFSTSSDMTAFSVATDEIKARIKQDEGLYAWCRKGPEDWRVFWMGNESDE